MNSSRDNHDAPPDRRPTGSYSGNLRILLTTSHDSSDTLLVEASSSRQQDTPLSKHEVTAALEFARASSARTYNITHLPAKKINVCVLGCQGNPGEPPSIVAAKINAFARLHPELKPDIIILLGDNFYPDGVSTPDDPRFETQFHGIYGNPELTEICKVPCIVVLGNHDGGRDTKSQIQAWVPAKSYLLGTNPHVNAEAELQQIAHSMLRHPSDPELDVTKAKLFQQEEIDYRQLPKHLMPHFYHSWVFNNFQVFAINSNTYAKDFLELMRQFAFDLEIDPAKNQAARMEMEYRLAMEKGRKTLFVMHHPLESVGKRVYPSGFDAKHYLYPDEIYLLQRILEIPPNAADFKKRVKKVFEEISSVKQFEKNANYNALLRKIMYDYQGMRPTMVSTAHDHAIYVYNNANDAGPEPKICQVVAGGGGSDELQDRMFFGKQENLGCFMREHGFAILSCDTEKPELFDINVVTTSGFHLKFTNQNSTPIRQTSSDQRVEDLRTLVLQSCKAYTDFLHAKQTETDGGFFSKMPSMSFSRMLSYNLTHTHTDVDCMHTIMNFLNQHTPMPYDDTIVFLYELMEKLQNKASDHSLYLDINIQLQRKFGKSIDQLHTDVQAKKTSRHYH